MTPASDSPSPVPEPLVTPAPPAVPAVSPPPTPPNAPGSNGLTYFAAGMMAFLLLSKWTGPPKPVRLFPTADTAMQASRPFDGSTIGMMLNPSPQTNPAVDRAQRTAAYWQATLVPLHRLRFDLSRGETETLGDYAVRQRQELGAALAAARASPTADVDPELVEFVRWNFELMDLELLALAWEPPEAPLSTLPAANQPMGALLDQVDERLATMTDEEYQQLPPDFRKMLELVMPLAHLKSAQFQEIVEMQATLQRRYPLMQSRFELPVLTSPLIDTAPGDTER